MITIRFVRAGRKGQAYFSLVAAEKSKAVQKKYIEKLGYYNPHANGGEGELVFNEERAMHFLKNGAQMSQSSARILSKKGFKDAGKFVTARVTKPKKTVPPTEAPQKEEVAEAPVEETPTSEPEQTESAPVETPETKEEEIPAEENSEKTEA